MERLEQLIEQYYPKDVLEMVEFLNVISEELGDVDPSKSLLSESSLNENKAKFSAARFYKTALKSFKAPTEQAGELGTEERRRFQKYITRNIKGKTLADKIKTINMIVEGALLRDPKISEIMGALGAVKMLQQTLDDFNESTAGFLFEAFLSGLLQGTQVTDRVGGSLPIEDCNFFVDPKTGQDGQPVSLKLLSPKTRVEGSIPNLLAFFRRPEIAAVAEEKGIEYIVATKTLKNELDIYSFNIKPSNFFYWIEEKYFNLNSYAEKNLSGNALQETLDEQKSAEDIERSKALWEKAFLLRAPMFGLNPADLEFNYDWPQTSHHSAPRWRKVVKPPSSARKAAHQAAEIILSPLAKEKFDLWKRSSLRVPSNVDHLEVTRLEREYRSEDSGVATAAAVELANIGKKRLIAYFDSIEHVGENVREYAGHIQRWWAINKKGPQHAESDVITKLQALISNGDAESIINWATTLEEMRLNQHTQFDINPGRVRAEGTLYGTINVNKRKIYRTLQQYSNQLADLCAPIYEELERLTSFINGYFLQNRAGDAFKAADAATRLSGHAKKLSTGTGDSSPLAGGIATDLFEPEVAASRARVAKDRAQRSRSSAPIHRGGGVQTLTEE